MHGGTLCDFHSQNSIEWGHGVNAELLEHESPEQRDGILGWTFNPIIVTGYGKVLDKDLAHLRWPKGAGCAHGDDIEGGVWDRRARDDDVVHGRQPSRQLRRFGLDDACGNLRQIAELLVIGRHGVRISQDVAPGPFLERKPPSVDYHDRYNARPLASPPTRRTGRPPVPLSR
jgi:hypothetical protein